MRILFIGGDKRMNCAADILAEKHNVERLGSGEYPLPKGTFDAIVLPLPLTRNGSEVLAPLSDSPLEFDIITRFAAENAVILAGGECSVLTDICRQNGYILVNYFAEETLTLKNAALTAEAACALLSQSTDGALLGSRSLITGYGRIAKLLAVRLKAHGSTVTIAARRAEQRVTAELDGFDSVSPEQIGSVISDVDFIANTVPSALFTGEHFNETKKDAVFIELATLPEQPSKPLAESRGVQYIYAPGLPGKYSPKAAGRVIADTVIEMLPK